MSFHRACCCDLAVVYRLVNCCAGFADIWTGTDLSEYVGTVVEYMGRCYSVTLDPNPPPPPYTPVDPQFFSQRTGCDDPACPPCYDPSEDCFWCADPGYARFLATFRNILICNTCCRQEGGSSRRGSPAAAFLNASFLLTLQSFSGEVCEWNSGFFNTTGWINYDDTACSEGAQSVPEKFIVRLFIRSSFAQIEPNTYSMYIESGQSGGTARPWQALVLPLPVPDACLFSVGGIPNEFQAADCCDYPLRRGRYYYGGTGDLEPI